MKVRAHVGCGSESEGDYVMVKVEQTESETDYVDGETECKEIRWCEKSEQH